MTKGGVTTDALDAEPLPPISPPQHSDSHSNNNGNGNHSTNGQEMNDMTKVSDPLQDDDAKSTTSEQDNERVREKLKKTSIANVRSDSSLACEHGEKEEEAPPSTAISETDQDMSDGKEDENRRRRKRSFDETEGDGDGDGGGGNKDQHTRHRVHERKRSREISDEDMAKAAKALNRVKTPPTHPEEDEIMSQGEEETSTSITSPRKLERKRGRGRLDEDEKDKEVDPKKKISRKEEEWNRAIEKSVPSTIRGSTSVNVSTSEMTNGKDSVIVESITMKPVEGELPSSSGFANTSVKSPFATAGANAKPLFGPGTSTSDLFKNSKFGTASASASPFVSASPFGSLGTQTSGSSSPFGVGGLSGGSKIKPSGFGNIGFGSVYGPSGFAALASKSGDVISSAPKLTKLLGSTPTKPFGTPEDDKGTSDEDDEGSDGDVEDKKEDSTADDKKEIFTEQEVVTGEENETTIFKTLGKIFFFDKENKQWKERGRGTLKLNRTIPFAEAECDEELGLGEKHKDSARLIMRTEGTYLVVLNVPIYKGMKIGGDPNGSIPTTNVLQFMTLENGTPIQMIIKCKSMAIAKELHKHVSDLQEELFT